MKISPKKRVFFHACKWIALFFFLMRFDKLLSTAQPNRKFASASEHRNEKKKKRELVPFLSPLHFATPATQPTENIYLKSALKYVQTIQDATAPQLLKADFINFCMDTYGYEPVYMMCLKLTCSFELGCHNILANSEAILSFAY